MPLLSSYHLNQLIYVDQDEWEAQKANQYVHSGADSTDAWDNIDCGVIFKVLDVLDEIDVQFRYLAVNLLFADFFGVGFCLHWVHLCVSFLDVDLFQHNIWVWVWYLKELLGHLLSFLNYSGRVRRQSHRLETVITYHHRVCLEKSCRRYAIRKLGVHRGVCKAMQAGTISSVAVILNVLIYRYEIEVCAHR